MTNVSTDVLGSCKAGKANRKKIYAYTKGDLSWKKVFGKEALIGLFISPRRMLSTIFMAASEGKEK